MNKRAVAAPIMRPGTHIVSAVYLEYLRLEAISQTETTRKYRLSIITLDLNVAFYTKIVK